MDETEMKKSKQYHGVWTACMPDVGFRFFRKCQYEFEIKPGAFISPHSTAIENESTSFVAAGWSWKGRSKDTKKEISGAALFFPHCPDDVVLCHSEESIDPSEWLANKWTLKTFVEANKVERVAINAKTKRQFLPSLEDGDQLRGQGIDDEAAEYTEAGTISRNGPDHCTMNDKTMPLSSIAVKLKKTLVVGIAADLSLDENWKGRGQLAFAVDGQWRHINLPAELKDCLEGEGGAQPIIMGQSTSLDLVVNTGSTTKKFKYQPSKPFPENSGLEAILDQGETPLLAAADRGHLEITDLLLTGTNEKNKSSNPLKMNTKNENLLWMLCKFDHIGTVQTLLDRESGVIGKKIELMREQFSRINSDGDTLLHVAVQNNSSKCLVEFAKLYPKLFDETNSSGMNPLHLAASLNKRRLIDSLISAFEEVKGDEEVEELKGDEEDGSLPSWSKVAAKELQCKDASDYLKTSQTTDGWTALHLAAKFDAVDAIDHLLMIEKGADVNVKGGPHNMTSLHLAAHEGKKKACEALVENHNADVGVVDDQGYNALVHACLSGDLVCVNYFLGIVGGLTKESSGKSGGDLPLHHVCRVGKGQWKEIIKQLVEKDFDINQGDENMDTPLHYLAKSKENPNTLGMVEDLLKKPNIEILSKNDSKMTPLELAIDKGNVEAVEGLAKHFEDRNSTSEERQLLLSAAKKHCRIQSDKQKAPSWELLECLLKAFYRKDDFEKLFKDGGIIDREFEALFLDAKENISFLEAELYYRLMGRDERAKGGISENERNLFDKENHLLYSAKRGEGINKENFRHFWTLLNVRPASDAKVDDLPTVEAETKNQKTLQQLLNGAKHYFKKIVKESKDDDKNPVMGVEEFKCLIEDLREVSQLDVDVFAPLDTPNSTAALQDDKKVVSYFQDEYYTPKLRLRWESMELDVGKKGMVVNTWILATPCALTPYPLPLVFPFYSFVFFFEKVRFVDHRDKYGGKLGTVHDKLSSGNVAVSLEGKDKPISSTASDAKEIRIVVQDAGTPFIDGIYYPDDSSYTYESFLQGSVYIKHDAMIAFWIQEDYEHAWYFTARTSGMPRVYINRSEDHTTVPTEGWELFKHDIDRAVHPSAAEPPPRIWNVDKKTKNASFGPDKTKTKGLWTAPDDVEWTYSKAEESGLSVLEKNYNLDPYDILIEGRNYVAAGHTFMTAKELKEASKMLSKMLISTANASEAESTDNVSPKDLVLEWVLAKEGLTKDKVKEGPTKDKVYEQIISEGDIVYGPEGQMRVTSIDVEHEKLILDADSKQVTKELQDLQAADIHKFCQYDEKNNIEIKPEYADFYAEKDEEEATSDDTDRSADQGDEEEAQDASSPPSSPTPDGPDLKTGPAELFKQYYRFLKASGKKRDGKFEKILSEADFLRLLACVKKEMWIDLHKVLTKEAKEAAEAEAKEAKETAAAEATATLKPEQEAQEVKMSAEDGKVATNKHGEVEGKNDENGNAENGEVGGAGEAEDSTLSVPKSEKTTGEKKAGPRRKSIFQNMGLPSLGSAFRLPGGDGDSVQNISSSSSSSSSSSNENEGEE